MSDGMCCVWDAEGVENIREPRARGPEGVHAPGGPQEGVHQRRRLGARHAWAACAQTLRVGLGAAAATAGSGLAGYAGWVDALDPRGQVFRSLNTVPACCSLPC